jgi:hypothetical protein
MSERPELGTWHTITATAHKSTFDSAKAGVKNETRWFNKVCHEVQGMFIGYRFVFSGKYHEGHHVSRSWDDEGDYYAPYFEQTQTHEVWLFVVNARQLPICAFPADVCLVSEKQS